MARVRRRGCREQKAGPRAARRWPRALAALTRSGSTPVAPIPHRCRRSAVSAGRSAHDAGVPARPGGQGSPATPFRTGSRRTAAPRSGRCAGSETSRDDAGGRAPGSSPPSPVRHPVIRGSHPENRPAFGATIAIRGSATRTAAQQATRTARPRDPLVDRIVAASFHALLIGSRLPSRRTTRQQVIETDKVVA